MVQLICTDIDGTLLNKERAIDPYTKRVFSGLIAKIPVVFASSRMPKALWYLQHDLGVDDMPIICYNGALVLSSGSIFSPDRILSSVTIPELLTWSIMDICLRHQLHVSIYCDNYWFASSWDSWTEREMHNTRVQPDGVLTEMSETTQHEKTICGAHKIMVMGEAVKIDMIVSELSSTHNVALCRSKATYLEITPLETDKSIGLGILLEKMRSFQQIKREHIMSFGDNHNDYELLRDTGYGIAVANAIPEIRKMAYAVTRSNVEHGVAFYLDEMLLKGKLV